MLCACAAWNSKNASSNWIYVNSSWSYCFDILHASVRILVNRVQICIASIRVYVERFVL